MKCNMTLADAIRDGILNNFSRNLNESIEKYMNDHPDDRLELDDDANAEIDLVSSTISLDDLTKEQVHSAVNLLNALKDEYGFNAIRYCGKEEETTVLDLFAEYIRSDFVPCLVDIIRHMAEEKKYSKLNSLLDDVPEKDITEEFCHMTIVDALERAHKLIVDGGVEDEN